VNRYAALAIVALTATSAAAQDARYVTFRTVQDEFGRTEHQVDRGTITQEGQYKVFWSRIWKPKDKQPVAISSAGQLLSGRRSSRSIARAAASPAGSSTALRRARQ
jgi:hypothetical protein